MKVDSHSFRGGRRLRWSPMSVPVRRALLTRCGIDPSQTRARARPSMQAVSEVVDHPEIVDKDVRDQIVF